MEQVIMLKNDPAAKSWLTADDIHNVSDAVFSAVFLLDPDYASKALKFFEKAGIGNTPYPAAFFMAQLRSVCPNRMVFDMIFYKFGISRDKLIEYNRFLWKCIEEDVEDPEDDDLPF